MEKPTKANFRDIEGQTFGRWKVLSFAGSDNGAKWLCECQCGTVRIVAATNLFQGSKSCGCLQKEAAKKTGKTLHKRRRKDYARKSHGMSKSPEYRAWNQMIQRCTNPNIRNYADYGGRGIIVCKEWVDSFEAFYRHIGPKPSSAHSLDRIDNSGNYEPGNVRWATDAQQRDNSRHPKKFLYQGELLSMSEIARRSGIKAVTLRARLVIMGWSVERATSQDPKAYHGRI